MAKTLPRPDASTETIIQIKELPSIIADIKLGDKYKSILDKNPKLWPTEEEDLVLESPDDLYLEFLFRFHTNITNEIEDLKNYLLSEFSIDVFQSKKFKNSEKIQEFNDLVTRLTDLERKKWNHEKILYEIQLCVNMNPYYKNNSITTCFYNVIREKVTSYGKPSSVYVLRLNPSHLNLYREARYNICLYWERNIYSIIVNSFYDVKKQQFSSLFIHFVNRAVPLERIFNNMDIIPEGSNDPDETITKIIKEFYKNFSYSN